MPVECFQQELHLPNELLSLIINELAPDTAYDDITRAALASCRLTSRVFCSLATPVLFSSIELSEGLNHDPSSHNDRIVAFEERATRLNQIVANHDIAASIQTLTLRCESLTNATLTSAILHHLSHIRNFTLECNWTLDFYSVTGDLASSIQTLCRSSTLTTLTLGNIIGFPIAVMTSYPNLRRLCLYRIEFCFDNLTSMYQPYLEFLELDEISTYSLGSGLTCSELAKYFSRIKNLKLRNLFFDYETMGYGWDIMLLASQSLATLNLSTKDFEDLLDVSDVISFDLSRFPALRHFKFQKQTAFWAYDSNTVVSCLSQLFSVSFSSSGIETLELELTWYSVGYELGSDLFSPDAGWSELDRLLTSEKFIPLKKFVLGLRLEMESERDTCNNEKRSIESERNLTLPYVNALFPLFRAFPNTQRTLDIHLEIV